MNLEKLNYFVDLVETGSFTKAGKKNFVSQASVTQQIQFLEDHFHSQLIDRSTIPVRPTESRKLLYQEALRLLQQYDQLTQRMADYQSKQQRIRIEYTSIMDIQLLSQIIRQKNIDTHSMVIDVEKVALKDLTENLLNDRYDLAISFDSEFYEEERIKTIPLYYGDYCALVGSKHPFFTKESLTLEELYTQKIMMLAPEVIGKSYYLMLDNALKDGYAPNIEKVTNDVETEIFTIQNSDMVGFFPENYPLINDEMDVKALPLKDSHHQFELVVAYRVDEHNPLIHQVLSALE